MKLKKLATAAMTCAGVSLVILTAQLVVGCNVKTSGSLEQSSQWEVCVYTEDGSLVDRVTSYDKPSLWSNTSNTKVAYRSKDGRTGYISTARGVFTIKPL